MIPVDPGARRTAMVVWAVAALAGTAAVWWLSSYIDELTRLAQTDREASLALFRTRVVPALLVVALIAVAAGAFVLRMGLQVLRTGRFPPDGARLLRDAPRQTGRPARVIGTLLAVAGFLLAAVPLMMMSLVFWMLA